jgi:hypothetical protein
MVYAPSYEIRTAEDWRLWADENIGIVAREPHRLGYVIGFDKLKPLHSSWIKYTWESNGPKALQAFRGGYKTTSVTVVGCVRWMLFHPDDRILLIRKTFTAAAEVIKEVSQIMQTRQIQELFRQFHGRYPKAKVDKAGKLSFNFKTKPSVEGNLTGMGTNQIVTGLHFDKVIADDIVTLQDRISRAERERTIEIVREIQANIIDPGKGSIWTGTPWHREDAWKVIRGFCDIARYPLSQYNFLGPEEAERRRRTTTPYLYAANNELELGKDESLLFTEPAWPRRWDYTLRGAMAQLDTAFDGDHWCAMTIAVPTRKEGGKQFYQAVGFAYPGNVEDWEPQIERYCKKYQVKYIFVETNADKGASAKRLASRGLRVKPYSEGMNKHIKIGTYLYEVWGNIEWAAETDEEYMSQITEYKEGVEPDDAPDSAASLFKEAFPQSSTSAREKWLW